MSWKWMVAKSTGTSHVRTGKGCDDAYACYLSGPDRDFLVAIACDGAGSAAFGNVGAQRTVRRLVVTRLFAAAASMRRAPHAALAAIADAHSLEAAGDKILRPLRDGTLGSAQAPWSGMIALDGNLTESLLSDIATSALFARADLRLAPASPGKADRLAPLLRHGGATLYANLEEARILSGDTSATTAVQAAEALLARGAGRVLVTNGGSPCAEGRAGQGVISATPRQVMVHRVTGAGDTFMAAHIVAERHGADRITALNAALRAAADFVSKEVGS
jgi:hypothetical protein